MEKWKSAITKIEPNKISVRGYSIDKLMGRISFAQSIYLVLKGNLPSDNIGKLLDAILVSSIDHGVTSPSTQAAITVASTGSKLNAALAAGILSINKYHGGAIESAMRIFSTIDELRGEKNLSINDSAKLVIAEMREKKEVVFGFGHRIHTQDPRTAKLFDLAEQYEVAGDFVKIARSIEKSLQKLINKSLPINVDGAIAAVLCDLGFTPEYGNLFFIVSRISVHAAHVFEEKNRYKPMRRIDPFSWEYDGPDDREIDG